MCKTDLHGPLISNNCCNDNVANTIIGSRMPNSTRTHRAANPQVGDNIRNTGNDSTYSVGTNTKYRENLSNHGNNRKTPNSPNLMRNVHRLKIGNIIVTTSRDDAKLVQVCLAAKTLAQDIMCLTETHRTGEGKIQSWPTAELDGWELVYSGLKRKAAAGCAVLLSPTVALIEYEIIEPGRILFCRVKYRGIRLCLWCCYGPTNTSSESSRLAFFRKLTSSLTNKQKLHEGWPRIAIGDFNATLGHDAPKSPYIGPELDSCATTDNGFRLAELLTEQKMHALNTLFQTKKPSHRITFSLGRAKKRLDYFIADKWLRYNCKIARAYPSQSAVFESNHRLCMAEFRLPSHAQRKKIFKHRQKKPRTMIKALRDDPIVRKNYSDALEALLPHLDPTDELNAEDLEGRIHDAITTAAKDTLPTVQEDRCDWVTQEYWEMVTELTQQKIRGQRNRLARKVKKLRLKLKAEFYHQRANDINQAAEMRLVEEEYRLTRERRMLSKASTTVGCPVEKLHRHFSEHFKAKPTPPAEALDDPELLEAIPKVDITIDSSEPTRKEVLSAVAKLKNNRCLGVDEIAGEHLKYAESPKLIDHLHALVLRVWSQNECPKAWQKSRLKPLFKNKGSMTDETKYRGLMINSTVNKVLIMIMLSRLKDHYEKAIHPSQYGFRQNRSTTDGVFIVRQMTTKISQPIWGCFVDLKAAYDWVDRATLWRVLRLRLGTSGDKLIDILENLYRTTVAELDGCKDPIHVLIGLRQGGPESCILFNYWLDTVIRVALTEIERNFPSTGIDHQYRIPNECTDQSKRCREERRLQAGTAVTEMILYADDILVAAKSENELEGKMQIIANTFTSFGMQLAEDKTVTMTWNTPSEVRDSKSLISVNQKPLENVRQFRYLGHVLTDNPKDPKFLEHQIGSAYGKWNEMKDIFTDQEIALKTRVKLAESMVRSRLTYAVQTERLSSAQRSKIDSIWARMCRKMVRGGFKRKESNQDGTNQYHFKYSNKQIMDICGTQPASLFCLKQHLKYLGHVVRRPNSDERKQWLFTANTRKNTPCQWKVLARDFGIDEFQLRQTLWAKPKLTVLLNATIAPGAKPPKSR